MDRAEGTRRDQKGASAGHTCGDVSGEEVVDAVADGGDLSDDAVGAGLTVQAADVVRHVVQDSQAVEVSIVSMQSRTLPGTATAVSMVSVASVVGVASVVSMVSMVSVASVWLQDDCIANCVIPW